ncbi:hypothetical protein D3C85_274430 [compost metagenome]
MKAQDFLRKGAELLEERGKQYDQPQGERSMGKAVAAFNVITSKGITEAEGWLLLQILKDVRQWQNPDVYHADSAEDCVSYAALKAEALSYVEPIINNPSRVELYSADAEARMDVIGQNGNGGEHYDAEKSERWQDAPNWATVLLKNKWHDHLTCFSESYTDGSRFLRSDFGKDICHDLDPDCWHVVETRP